ncbi:UPF0481 protein At3g47200-like [Ananas comosus]|uniref:UPF0481 protein At3g47200-like n=1 Tax=Ananas comosus TaxID=4615 RepID=A0A6P5GKK9_ANACO|nr:UPF0481 protein At3g47200-like [Ananas comosus]
MVNTQSLDVEKYLTKMDEEEKENGRFYYSEHLFEWISRKDFQTMLLLDSSFILFVIHASRESQPQSLVEIWDYMTLCTDVRKHMKQIKLDLLMADNQIPFFAIKKLSECFPEHEIFSSERYSIGHLALSCFADLWPTRNEEQKMDDEMDFDNLLHLFHWSRIRVEGYELYCEELDSEYDLEQYIPSATELRKSAVKFEKKHSRSNLDITFTRGLMKMSGVIKIPTLHLYDYSEEIFRNLIAFEKNPTNDVHCFMPYSACMSCLLQREEDVKLLRESGIIASTGYNDADVVQFFKGLNSEVQDRLTPDTLLRLYGRVMIHHNSRVSRAYGGFKLQYCPNTWVGLSLVAASILFILTLLQTIYAIKQK